MFCVSISPVVPSSTVYIPIVFNSDSDQSVKIPFGCFTELIVIGFGWMVQRVTMDSSKTIPSDVTKYCNDIRTDCSDIITSINNCTITAQIRALHTDTVDSDGKVTEVARINRWSSDSAVTGYKR